MLAIKANRGMSKNNEKKFIQVEELVRKKNQGLAKWMPRPLMNYLKRTLHEDDINDIMCRFRDLKGLDFVDALISDLDVKVVIEGEENIPLEESVIFASNHPLGGLDGIAFMQAIGQYRRDVKFIVNDFLMNISNLEPLFVGVNKIGEQSKSALVAVDEAYASDHALLVFPAGLVSRKIKGQIVDLDWKKSFISRAKKYKKDIIPVYIDGRNSNFFYGLARLRNKLGIKFNLEMLYLVDELFAQRGQLVTIKIGKKIPYTELDQTRSERQWAAEIRRQVYEIKK